MPHEILQQFLKQNLLDLGEDNARWKYLTDTANQLSSAFLQDRSQLIPALLVAIDPECPVDEPIFDLVEDQLMEQWPLLRQKYIAERPRQILRAILLQAIAEAQTNDSEVGAIVWLAGSSYLQSLSTLGHSLALRIETQLIQDALDIFENVGSVSSNDNEIEQSSQDVEQADEPQVLKKDDVDEVDSSSAALDWLTSLSLNEDEISDTSSEVLPSINPSDFNDLSTLTILWASFMGKTYRGQDLPDMLFPNPFEIYDSYNETSADFINEAAPRIAKFFLDFTKFIKSQITAQAESEIRTTVASFKQELESRLTMAKMADVKNPILWWKSALYSPRLRRSYRQMSILQAAICMSSDLADIVPPIYPISVDFILAETVRDLLRTSGYTGEETLKFSEVTGIGRETSSVEVLRVVIPQGTIRAGRGSLLNYIQTKLQYPTNTALDIKAKVGVAPDTEIAITDLVIWIFRDIQAQKLIAGASRGDKS